MKERPSAVRVPARILGQAGGQHDVPQHAGAAGAGAQRRPHQRLLDAARAVIGADRHRQQAADEDGGDLRPRPDAEPQDEHRDERRLRHRVEAADERVDDDLHRRIPRHQDADHRADEHAGAEPADEIDQRGGAVDGEIAVEQQRGPGAQHRAQRRQRRGRDEAEARRRLPGEGEDEQRGVAGEGGERVAVYPQPCPALQGGRV